MQFVHVETLATGAASNWNPITAFTWRASCQTGVLSRLTFMEARQNAGVSGAAIASEANASRGGSPKPSRKP